MMWRVLARFPARRTILALNITTATTKSTEKTATPPRDSFVSGRHIHGVAQAGVFDTETQHLIQQQQPNISNNSNTSETLTDTFVLDVAFTS
jgi:hypothetical protein